MKHIAIIGSGFSSLAAACYLAQAGMQVSVFEKNSGIGGRARQLRKDGFTFDMGPSWYWMPDIFERFFADFQKRPSDYYTLDRLNPAYTIFFKDDTLTIRNSLEEIYNEFERIEPGSSATLKEFIHKARKHYRIAMDDLVYRPGISPLELVNWTTVSRIDQFFKTVSGEVRRRFRNPKLVAVLEFPVLFLGAKPSDTPAFYTFMNYADFGLGTWHPRGGMFKVIEGIRDLATSLQVKIHTSSPAERILVSGGKATGVQINGQEIPADVVLSGADYQHTETLLPLEYRQYSEKYWESRVFAPSSLLFYVGLRSKVKGIFHHNLFFDTDFSRHAQEIYDNPKWPSNPLFYANFPSVTDPEMAPAGCEAGFFLIPIAPNLEDGPLLRERYWHIISSRFLEHTGQDLESNLLFRESFCLNDFKEAYNAYKGNAYGMANTLRQTAFMRPRLKSKKVQNLFFTGQLTVPGPGVPPALISGKLVSEQIRNSIKLAQV